MGIAKLIAKRGADAMGILDQNEKFWNTVDIPGQPMDLVRFSLFLGLLPFSGYLFSYTITGKVWSVWPFVQSTLSVTRGLMCAGLHWIFFATFPLLSSLLLESLIDRQKPSPNSSAYLLICTYAMVPLFIAALFVGVPFMGRVSAVLGFAAFLYFLYYGYRIYLKQSLVRSAVLTFASGFLFALIRQMFVFVIGF